MSSPGTKKSRWRPVCVATKSAYSATEVTPAKTSCDDEYVGPRALVVNVGSTRQTAASVTTVLARRARALGVELGEPEARRADDQREPDDAVHRDHHGGNDHVARKRVGLAAARDRERDDEPDLDDGHRDGEDERPERLADSLRDDLGVMHGRQDCGGEDQRDDNGENVVQLATPRRAEYRRRADG